MTTLSGKHIAFLATDGVEESELSKPWEALKEAGAKVTLVSLEKGEIQAEKDNEKTRTFPVDDLVGEVKVEDFDALVLPGGLQNPDTLRSDKNAVAFVKGFFKAGKPVSAICHGPWLLAEADVLEGRKVTSYKSIRTDMLNAGARWTDEAVVVDGNLVTSRCPDDLPAFCEKTIEQVAKANQRKVA
ncbi:MAG: type 1 glutamine amidotransferase [Alphaproteobacteria bacterium]|nr:type 1 glutamine amidotransferase [Alphaproteobacteria bacterium]